MDNKYALLELKTNKLVDSLFVGNYKTKFKSKGIEFADFREYSSGDDVKNIDWIQSNKEGKTLVKLYDEERELSMYFIIDFENGVEFDLDGENKKTVFEELIYILGLSAIKGGDKVGSFLFNKGKNDISFAKKGKSSLLNIVNKFNDFGKTNNSDEENNSSNGLKYFNSLKINKSLVFLLSSSLDLDEKQLKILAIKHDLVYLNIFHSFENTLNSKGLKKLSNNGESLFVNTFDKNKKSKYQDIRKNKINDFKIKIRKYGADYIYVDEKINLYSTLLKFMNNR